MNKQEKQLVEKILPKFKMNELPYGETFDDNSMGLNMMVLLGEYLSDEMRKRFDTYDDKIVDVMTFVDRCVTQTTTLTKIMDMDIIGIEDSSVYYIVVLENGFID